MNKKIKRLSIWQTSKVTIIGLLIMLFALNLVFALGTICFARSAGSFYANIVIIPIFTWVAYKHNQQVTNQQNVSLTKWLLLDWLLAVYCDDVSPFSLYKKIPLRYCRGIFKIEIFALYLSLHSKRESFIIICIIRFHLISVYIFGSYSIINITMD